MYYRFENLDVWKLARLFSVEIYRISNKFPKSEIFGLISQIRRAAISVALNIAEGSSRGSDLEFKRFLRISLGSISEVVTTLYIALDLELVTKNQFDNLYKVSGELTAKIKALISSLGKK
ncbi:MAG: hypothetical protein A3I32_01215 [Candidatus Yanofskybacteria bacterium RIFCSPLOWO2_02_FULL_45_10]|uniref:Four helix bundle protein n=2 Tax=Candidatus Yanofskyibacteriota TaxID=1752733 RepID=A0A1F8G742_9BACT|nr:MAG: hypothetical protein A3F25_02330 [Candidatus Yanofskybacteria bacterium RIFCSPHIGHO2_12_FULL_45_19b]OGN31493.1 MAG: hypothetical protein A3I32_01215 [Candidatus Yanofskybacteria bacterium RIFCSPLOWO2_02_FULL_45_10]